MTTVSDLGLAAREDRAAVRARQNADFDRQRRISSVSRPSGRMFSSMIALRNSSSRIASYVDATSSPSRGCLSLADCVDRLAPSAEVETGLALDLVRLRSFSADALTSGIAMSGASFVGLVRERLDLPLRLPTARPVPPARR